MLAKLAASLDLLSGGRLILGLGGGYSDPEITALGSPQPGLVTGPVTRVLGQLHDLLDLGFDGLSFLPAGPDRKAGMQQIAEEIIPVLRSARS